MGVIWTLLVEVREEKENIAVDMTLLDEERRWQWRVHREIDRNQFDHLRKLVKDCFSPKPQSGLRGERMLNLATTISGDLRLEGFLDDSRLDNNSHLVINTTATGIPWDLVLFRGKHLASELAVVLNIPIVNERYFRRDYLGRAPRLMQRHDGKLKFLHIVANPYGDLEKTDQEKRALEGIVKSAPDLDYLLLDNPTVHEVLDELSQPGLRYLHYSGHIQSGLGLLVGKRQRTEVVKTDTIESRFPGTDREIVFLNGCDRHLDQSDMEVLGPVTVANAFLNAGAGAVIAPRSKIPDDDQAVEAAVYIWQRFLLDDPPVSLEHVVRDYRRKSVESRRNDLGGYTYVLYGTGRTDTHRPRSENQSVNFNERLRENPIIRQAAFEADGTIGPRHVFAVLTRGWELGRVFFSHFDQRYIFYLTELRKALGCQQIAPRTSPLPEIRFSSGMELLLSAIIGVLGREATPTAMDFVSVIATIGDSEIVGALQQLEISGLDLKDICQTALLLGEDPAPQALFQPDGWAQKQLFLRGFYDPKRDCGNAADTDAMIDVWQIFTALARADGNLGRLIECSGLERPPSGVWSVDVPLHWCSLTNSAQNTLMVAAREMRDEQAKCTSESHLVYALLDDEQLDWENLPDNARDWIGGRARWKDLVENIRLERFGWASD